MTVTRAAEDGIKAGAASWLALGSPWIAAGVVGAGLLFKLFDKGDPPPPDAFDSTRRFQEPRRAQSEPAQFVVGTARTAGVTLLEADKQYAGGSEGGGAFDALDTQKVRYLYTAHLLTHGRMSHLSRVWINGLEVPLRTPTAVALTGGRSRESDGSAHNARVTALRARQRALVPGSLSATNAVQNSVVAAADAVARELWWELQARVDDLRNAQTWPTLSGGTVTPDGFRRGTGGWRQVAGGQNWPAFVVSWGDGSLSDAVGRAVTRARGRVPYWRASDRVEGIGWALCEYRMWERDGALFPFSPGSAPNVEFLAHGDPELASATASWGANPAKWLSWYLRTQCGIEADRLVGFDAAAAWYDGRVLLPTFTRAQSATPTSSAPVTGPMLLARYYTARGADLPSDAWQDRVLAELSARWSGAGNARARFALNGVIGSDMRRDDVIASVAAATVTDIVEVGGRWYCRPEAYQTPVVVQSSDLAGTVDWMPDTEAGRSPNSLTASIAQDRDRAYERTTLEPVDQAAIVVRDGRFGVNLGGLPLVRDWLDAYRILTIRLQRDNYGLRRAVTAVKVPSSDAATARLVPSDYVQLQADGLDLLMRVTGVRHGRGVALLQLVETPPLSIPEPPAPMEGPFDFDIFVEDDTGVPATLATAWTASMSGSTAPRPALSVSVPAIAATRGTAGSVNISVSNAPGGWTVALKSGPPWLTLGPGGETLAWGALTFADTDTTDVVVTVTRTADSATADSAPVTPTIVNQADFDCSVTATGRPAPVVTDETDSLGDLIQVAFVGSNVRLTASATGGTAPYSYAWSEDSDDINVLTTDQNGARVLLQVLSNGQFNVSFTATDSTGKTATCRVRLSRRSRSGPTRPDTPFAVTAGDATATGGGSYSIPVTWTGSETPQITFSGLPSGASYANGAITGIAPNETRTYSFTVTGTLSGDRTASDTGTLTVTASTTPVIACPANQAISGAAGSAISLQIPAPTGATGAVTYSGTIPAAYSGVSMTSGGLISGAHPSSAASGSFAVTVADAGTGTSCSLTVTLTTNVANQISCAIPPRLSGQPGDSFSEQIAAPAGATGTVTYSKVSGPSWLAVSASGVVSGTVPAGTAASQLTYRYRASDAGTSTTCQDASVFEVQSPPPPPPPPPALAAPAPPALATTVGSTVTAQCPAPTGATGAVTYARATGPSGLTISATGAVSFTASAAGTFSYSYTVTDASGASATSPTASVTVTTVGAELAVTLSNTRVTGFTGQQYQATATATGGTPPYTLALKSGSSSAVSISGSTITLAAQSSAGTYSYTVVATDADGDTAEVAGSFVIAAGATMTLAARPQFTGHVFGEIVASVTGGRGTGSWSYSLRSAAGTVLATNTTGVFPNLQGDATYRVVATRTGDTSLSQSVRVPRYASFDGLPAQTVRRGTAVSIAYRGRQLTEGDTTYDINDVEVLYDNVPGGATWNQDKTRDVGNNVVRGTLQISIPSSARTGIYYTAARVTFTVADGTFALPGRFFIRITVT